ARAGTAEWEDVPNETPGLRELDEGDGAQGLSRLDLMADQIDFRVVFDWEVGAFDSEFFLSTGWLTAPRLTEFLIDYLAEPRVDRRGEVRE
ncbi:MAG: hypothetical protein MK213_07695, partial [Planctomycetes bacterium]|nr:hypothetical protein [Planctomycetota bacterium]